MARGLAGLVLALALLVAAPVAAQDGPEEAGAVAMEHDGEAGVWLPLDLARDALEAYADQDRVQTRLRLLEDALEVRTHQVALYRQAADLGDKSRGYLSAALEDAILARQVAEERADAWWRHPGLWFGVGSVVGVLAVVIPALLL